MKGGESRNKTARRVHSDTFWAMSIISGIKVASQKLTSVNARNAYFIVSRKYSPNAHLSVPKDFFRAGQRLTPSLLKSSAASPARNVIVSELRSLCDGKYLTYNMLRSCLASHIDTRGGYSAQLKGIFSPFHHQFPSAKGGGSLKRHFS